jgi:hypothetical protein
MLNALANVGFWAKRTGTNRCLPISIYEYTALAAQAPVNVRSGHVPPALLPKVLTALIWVPGHSLASEAKRHQPTMIPRPYFGVKGCTA